MHIFKTPGSSNIIAFAWQAETLYIQFKKTDQVYAYADVPEGVHTAMVMADSVGSFFHAHVKKAFSTRVLSNDESFDLGFARQDVTVFDA